MRLVSYGPFGAERAGIWLDKGIVDLQQAMAETGIGNPVTDMRLFLEQENWRQMADQIVAARIAPIDPKGVRFGAPVPMPRKLMIAGANTHTHVAEAGAVLGKIAAPREPMILAKATSCIAGAYDDLIHPPETRKLDYEVELGVVIGKKCRRIKESEARDYIAGYVATNEVSARDLQLAEHEENPFFRVHFLGKSYDSFCPMGPALVTIDEFEWGKPITLKTTVNGEVRQSNDTGDLVHGLASLVEYCSRAMTLFPGDIICTGSPAGVAFFMKPQAFLKPGDRVRCEVGGVGATDNLVRAEDLAG
jgi:2-keto-4-pentenoate hydratase/2-oxohepta-3-ene-1,7-dioic acid hydratase in catechol pathway